MHIAYRAFGPQINNQHNHMKEVVDVPWHFAWMKVLEEQGAAQELSSDHNVQNATPEDGTTTEIDFQ